MEIHPSLPYCLPLSSYIIPKTEMPAKLSPPSIFKPIPNTQMLIINSKKHEKIKIPPKSSNFVAYEARNVNF